MARPPRELLDRETICQLIDSAGRLALRVTPGARTESMTLKNGKVHIKVRVKPEGGAANCAVIALLAAALDCAPSCIRLLHGTSGREKLVQIDL